MANRRMIYQDFFEDDYFGTVDMGLRLLWIGLITAAADDQGRILDNSALIRAKVFMYDPNITTEQIDKWLHKLNEDNKVVRYKVKSKQLIQIVKWWDYQTPAWASPSKYPAPDKWTDRVRCHVSGPKQGGGLEIDNWEQSGGYDSKQVNKLPSKQGSSQGSGIDDINDDDDDKLRKDDDDSELRNANSDFSDYQKVWEGETGTPVSALSEFVKMCKVFEKAGVTPEIYRIAIKEQSQSDYAVKRPTSVKEWAIGLVKPSSTGSKSAKPLRTQVYIGPNGEEIEMEVG